MSEQNTINIGKNKLPHFMSRGGYPAEARKLRKAAVEAGDKTAADPMWLPDRTDLYISGHTPRSGPPSAELQAVIDTVVSNQTLCLNMLVNCSY